VISPIRCPKPLVVVGAWARGWVWPKQMSPLPPPCRRLAREFPLDADLHPPGRRRLDMVLGPQRAPINVLAEPSDGKSAARAGRWGFLA
jgi:hypothetical protein